MAVGGTGGLPALLDWGCEESVVEEAAVELGHRRRAGLRVTYTPLYMRKE